MDEPDKSLDEIELFLAAWAVQEDIPTLGVCRGMQVLNVALGGTLYQDIEDIRPGSRPFPGDTPRFPGTPVEALTGQPYRSRAWHVHAMVKSLHHQAVNKPGKGVVISGRAEDGIAELLSRPTNALYWPYNTTRKKSI